MQHIKFISLLLLSLSCLRLLIAQKPQQNQLNQQNQQWGDVNDLLDLDKYEISIENSLDGFQESSLDSYFPIMLAKDNVIYCQNIKKEDSESKNKRRYSDSQKIKEEAHEIIKTFYPKTGKKCSTLRSGWWDYEFCFPNLFRQYHQNEDGAIPFEYILGKGDVDQVERTLILDVAEPSLSYMEYVFKNGSICAVTNEPREVRVHFYCNINQPRVENYFGNIIEPKSCLYIASFFMKKLCDITGFKQVETKTIQCLDQDTFKKFLDQLHQLNDDLEILSSQNKNQKEKIQDDKKEEIKENIKEEIKENIKDIKENIKEDIKEEIKEETIKEEKKNEETQKENKEINNDNPIEKDEQTV